MDAVSMATEAGATGEESLGAGTPDADLVARTLAGTPESFGRLYDRYVRLVHATCFDVTGDAAEDLVHETFVRAHRGLPALREPDRFAAWLLGIAHRVCKDWERKRA